MWPCRNYSACFRLCADSFSIPWINEFDRICVWCVGRARIRTSQWLNQYIVRWRHQIFAAFLWMSDRSHSESVTQLFWFLYIRFVFYFIYMDKNIQWFHIWYDQEHSCCHEITLALSHRVRESLLIFFFSSKIESIDIDARFHCEHKIQFERIYLIGIKWRLQTWVERRTHTHLSLSHINRDIIIKN